MVAILRGSENEKADIFKWIPKTKQKKPSVRLIDDRPDLLVYEKVKR